MLNLGYKMFIYANQVSQDIFKVELDETQWKAFEWELKKRGVDTQEEADLFYEKMKNNPNKSKEFISSVASVAFKDDVEKIKKIMSLDKIKQTTSKIDSLSNILEQTMKNYENKIE
jgi:hypothetical protein